jgi:hypothetical protein
MNIRWSSIDRLVYSKDTGDTAYQLLIENFRELGFMSDADNCYYQFRIEQYLQRNPLSDPVMLLLDLGGWIFYGYGKKPLYPLGWSIGSVIIFGAFWYIVGRRKHENQADEYSSAWGQAYNKSTRRSRIHSILESFIFSATVFLSGTRFFIDLPEVPISSRWPRSFIGGMFTFERVLGAFFSILLFLAISGTTVR